MTIRHRKYVHVYYSQEDFGCLRAIVFAFPFMVIFWMLLIAVTMAYGQQKPDVRLLGHDFLALQHPDFPVKKAAKYVTEPAALGMLDFTFGESLRNVEYLLDSGKFSALRVHLINGSCIRMGNCGRYYPFYGYDIAKFEKATQRNSPKIKEFIRDRVLLYCNLLRKYPATELLISPVLEHNLSQNSWRNMASLVKWQCPEAKLVNNSMDGIKYAGVLNERHGHPWRSKTDIFSLDGFEYYETDTVDALFNHKLGIFFIWTGMYNCRVPGKFIDPRARTTCTTGKQIQELDQYFRNFYE